MKKILSVFFGMMFILIILNIISAEVTSCCEKEKTGAWCQNSPENRCDTNFRISATSCDATSFCKMGCCVDTQEGLCSSNTPERVCEMGTGTWVDDSECNPSVVPQCRLGCCILGDQASFVTLTRCKKLSSFYGLETNFKTDITDETSCILEAHKQDKGACVYEVDNEKTCKFTTRDECNSINKGTGNISSANFHKDLLCSADELGTNCGPSEKTMCVQGENEVYFMDTCGNPGNIYDSSRVKDTSYWKRTVAKANSCGASSAKGNAGSKTCGNCEYFKGSICAKGSANYGDYACKDLNCYKTENGKNYKNGESWCIYQGAVGNGQDLVGNRYYRHLCVNGEEITEACADFRNEVCIENQLQTTDGNFVEAACRTNRWQTCVDQDNQEDCLNKDLRECYWTSNLGLIFTKTTQSSSSLTSSTGGFSGGTASFGGGTSATSSTTAASTTTITGGLQLSDGKNVCLPSVAPGLKFWNNGDASNICSLANSQCVVQYQKNGFQIIGEWITGDEVKGKCVENCTCLTENWVKQVNKVCSNLGDCGAKVNIAGKYTNNGVEWKVSGEKRTIQKYLLDSIRTGSVV